jgi:hypothetical protein
VVYCYLCVGVWADHYMRNILDKNWGMGYGVILGCDR